MSCGFSKFNIDINFFTPIQYYSHARDGWVDSTNSLEPMRKVKYFPLRFHDRKHAFIKDNKQTREFSKGGG